MITKVCYFEVADESESERFEDFLYNIVGLKFKCHNLHIDLSEVESIAKQGERPLTDRTK